ncbi:MAG: 4Fe-4S double cluster binding domain-containing protein [Caldilineaceae bacterium]
MGTAGGVGLCRQKLLFVSSHLVTAVGSYLATILVPEELAYDPPLQALAPEAATQDVFAGLAAEQMHGSWLQLDAAAPHQEHQPQLTCGRCVRCLDACPTAAFVGPYHLDPQRCISYWTIEAKAAIPRALRPAFGNRIFGCDICQEVCPWNQRLPSQLPQLAGLLAQSERIAPPLLQGFAAETPYWLQQEAFSRRFRRSPIKRAKRVGMLRNVCVALGNWGEPAAIGALEMALIDEAPLARLHAAWALGQIWRKTQHPQARAALWSRLHGDGALAAREEDESVRAEVTWALCG